MEADVVLRGGTLHDGSGKPGVVGDLAIKGDRVVAIGKFDVAGKPREIDARVWSSPRGSSTCTRTPTTRSRTRRRGPTCRSPTRGRRRW
ncbi:MAG: hypothetical protein U0797_03530 [Gemmataceae bacterium]